MNEDIVKAKKIWLRRYRNNREQIERLKNKIEQLDERSLSARSANLSGMPRGSGDNTSMSFTDKKLDLERRINILYERGKEIRREILSAIDELDDVRYAEVLELWFVNMLPLSEISEQLGYSERHILSLYKKAVESLVIPTVEG